jgi:uncharacterized protein with HEPN domain
MPHDLARSGGGGDTPSSEDRLRVEHMLQSSRDARAIIGKDDAVALAADMIRTRAMVNCFTEIGEAAARLTPQGRIRVGQIPWRQIVGMRNIVVHVYWGIDLAVLVKTAQDDLPVLIEALESALAAWPLDPPPSA